jgi:hypothetical protein
MPKKDENWVKKKLKEMLDGLGAFHFPASAGAFSVGGISDRLVCYKGRFIAIEAKRPGRSGEVNEGLSGLQVKFGKDVEKAGGLFFVVDDVESIEDVRKVLLSL